MVAVFEASLLCLTVKLSILICYKTPLIFIAGCFIFRDVINGVNNFTLFPRYWCWDGDDRCELWSPNPYWDKAGWLWNLPPSYWQNRKIWKAWNRHQYDWYKQVISNHEGNRKTFQ